MNNFDIDKVISENEELKKENAELRESRDAYVKKSEYLSKELKKHENGKGHMSTLEIVTDLALTLCVALLLTIVAYTSAVHDEGFFTLIRNAFALFF